MPNHQRPPTATFALDQARSLRTRSTQAEQKLWQHLRAGNLCGYKFRRQHPIPPYIADFFCACAKLVVELDGSQHTEQSDRARTKFLEAQGYRVLRFWDNDVLMQIEAVLEAILGVIAPSPLTPTPLPLGEGLQIGQEKK